MHPKVAALLDKYTFLGLPANVSVLWTFGGTISSEEDRSRISVNEALALAYVQKLNAQALDFKGTADNRIRTACSDILPWYDRQGKWVFPDIGPEFTALEEDLFWRILSTRFVNQSSGIVTVAVNGTKGNTQFRRLEFGLLMNNDNVTHIRILTGRPMLHGCAWIHKTTGEILVEDWLTSDSYVALKETHQMRGWEMLPDENLEVLPKEVWAERAKQEWFDLAYNRLVIFLSGRKPADREHGSDRADWDFCMAKAAFITEINSVLTEIARLKSRGYENDSAAMTNEIARLRTAAELVKSFPEIFFFDEPPTELEVSNRMFKNYLPTTEERRDNITTELGFYFLKLDDQLSIEEKIELWGWYKSPQSGKYLACEEYTRLKLQNLKKELEGFMLSAS